MRSVGEMRSPRDGDEEVRLLGHNVPPGEGRCLGIRNKAGAAGGLLWFQGFCRNAPPSTIDHEGETTAIHNEECRNNPRCNKRVCVYELANTLLVSV